jgi:CubicO group peptidase (beta-lactamase class C family)
MTGQDKIREIFQENFARRGEVGASVSIWQNGREILSLADGWCDREKTIPWRAETPVLVYSATKGPAAACVLHCVEKSARTLDTRVAEIWPEFGAAGKEQITIGEILSHQAGLAALDDAPDVFDYDAVIRAIESQPPRWMPNEGHGYHPRTFGFLLDEIVRRMCDVALGEYWREYFAEPLELDLWIGLPPEKLGTVSPIHTTRNVPAESPFLRAFADSDSLTSRAFGSPRGLHSVSSMNTPKARSASFPAFGGISTASALAKFYAMLASDGGLDGRHFFSARAIEWMTTARATGFDKVLQMQTAFSAGFMKDPADAEGRKLRALFGPSQLAFGQPGAGGSLAFADPENQISFAYVMNQMEPGVLPNEKSLRLVRALYESASAA